VALESSREGVGLTFEDEFKFEEEVGTEEAERFGLIVGDVDWLIVLRVGLDCDWISFGFWRYEVKAVPTDFLFLNE